MRWHHLCGLPLPLVVRLVCPSRCLPGLSSSRPGLLLHVLVRWAVLSGGGCWLTSLAARGRMLSAALAVLPPPVLLPATACGLLAPVVPMSAPSCVLVCAVGGVGVLLGSLRLVELPLLRVPLTLYLVCCRRGALELSWRRGLLRCCRCGRNAVSILCDSQDVGLGYGAGPTGRACRRFR